MLLDIFRIILFVNTHLKSLLQYKPRNCFHFKFISSQNDLASRATDLVPGEAMLNERIARAFVLTPYAIQQPPHGLIHDGIFGALWALMEPKSNASLKSFKMIQLSNCINTHLYQFLLKSYCHIEFTCVVLMLK